MIILLQKKQVGPNVIYYVFTSWLLLVVGCWLLAVGCWLLVVGCLLLVVGCLLLVVGAASACLQLVRQVQIDCKRQEHTNYDSDGIT